MNKYEKTKHKLIRKVVNKELDAFELIDMYLTLKKKNDMLKERINNGKQN